MLEKNEKKTQVSSKEMDLSFEFIIESLSNRVLTIEIDGMLRTLEYNPNYFDWFMEDLIDYISSNGIQKRWDFETIVIKNIDKLNLNEEDEKNFKNKFKTVTNWDMRGE